MKSKFEIVLYLLLIFLVLAWNDKIIPRRLEISDVEPVRVLGLDSAKDGDNIVMSVVREEKGTGKSFQSGQSGGNEGSENKQEIVTIMTSNFEKAIRALQTYKSKQFLGGHVKFVIIGEEIAKNDFINAFDFIVRDVELRLTTQLYIARGMTANEVMIGEAGSQEKMADVLNNLNKNVNSFGINKEEKVIDILDLAITEGKAGLIPTLISSKTNKYNNKWEIESSAENESESVLQFAGYAVIKNAKLIGYLSLDESRGANFFNNVLKTTVISVKSEEEGENEINLDVITSNTKSKFLFEEDNLVGIEVTNKSKSNITQMNTQKNVLNREVIMDLEKKQSAVIKNELQMVIDKSKELNADFLNFEGALKLRHPYKYEKLKDKWDEILKTVPIEIVVESEVRRTYDILDLEGDK